MDGALILTWLQATSALPLPDYRKHGRRSLGIEKANAHPSALSRHNRQSAATSSLSTQFRMTAPSHNETSTEQFSTLPIDRDRRESSPSSSTRPTSSERSRTSAASSAGRIDVTSALYRDDVLELNGIYVEKNPGNVPAHILEKTFEIQHALSLEVIPEQVAREWCAKVVEVEDAAEDRIFTVLSSILPIFPLAEHSTRLAREQKVAFRSAYAARVLPVSQEPQNKVSRPAPDLTYGLTSSALGDRVWRLCASFPRREYSQPMPGLFWPFFVVEFKAPARGGTLPAAINQCAGDGSACLSAALVLEDSGPPWSHNIAFSCAIDGQTASIFVHWKSDDTNRPLRVSNLNRYLLSNPEDLSKLSWHVRGILHWGTGERCELIKAALSEA